MADKNTETEGNKARFGYSEGELFVVDDNGNHVRIGDIPENVQKEIKKREQKKGGGD